jgi:DNA invertase Pin-like site-specific DNA recombinase
MSENTTTPLVRAGGYCRISSDHRDKRHGVTRQREDITALCEVKGWTPTEFYTDNDRSASTGKERPEWDRLLADVRAGKIDAIAAWDQDRGWRMMAELEQLRHFFTGLDRQVPLATTGQGDIDLYSPTGVLAAQIKTAVSEHEVSMMRVRMRRAARQKAEQGRPQWRHATGYVAGQPDPQFARLLTKVYRLVLSGGSLRDGCKVLNDAKAYRQWVRRPTDPATGERDTVVEYREWTEPSLSAFLRKPRNAGLREHKGEIIGKGTWEPLVDEDLWRGVQDVMSRHREGRRAYRRHLLSGVLRCGKCGHHLTAQQTIKGGIQYHCKNCHGIGIAAEHVEPFVLDLTGGRLAMPDAADLLHAAMHDTAEAEQMREQVSTLNARLAGLGREHGLGLLTAIQVKEATNAINEQLTKIEAARRDADRVSVFDGIRLGTPDAIADVAALTPDRLRAVIAVLATLTVMPTGKGGGARSGTHGGRVFDPRRIAVEWL